MTDLDMMWSSLRVQLDAHRPGLVPVSVGEAEHQIPVTILTGFLGSGKSTLLARLLTDPADGLIVRAVVNDVGSLPFDPTLLVGAAQVEVELSNGCGCCERTADLAATLDRLADDPTVDLIVLEASGIADPMGLGQVVEARPALRLDRIVVAVDGGAVEAQLANPSLAPTVRRQLESAHGVVITNTDRLSAGERARALATVAAAAPGRVITFSTLSEPAAGALVPSAVRGAGPTPTRESPPHDLFSLTVAPGEPPIRRADLEEALAERSAGIVRAKGRLPVDDGFVFVQMTSTSTTITPAEEGECGFTIVAGNAAEAAGLAAMIAGRR